eukprot:Skav222927  [mRNA]  locus=scaffold1489:355485:367621:+ [translate_table: standard]
MNVHQLPGGPWDGRAKCGDDMGSLWLHGATTFRAAEVCHENEDARDLGDFRQTAKLLEKLEDAPGVCEGKLVLSSPDDPRHAEVLWFFLNLAANHSVQVEGEGVERKFEGSSADEAAPGAVRNFGLCCTGKSPGRVCRSCTSGWPTAQLLRELHMAGLCPIASKKLNDNEFVEDWLARWKEATVAEVALSRPDLYIEGLRLG